MAATVMPKNIIMAMAKANSPSAARYLPRTTCQSVTGRVKSVSSVSLLRSSARRRMLIAGPTMATSNVVQKPSNSSRSSACCCKNKELKKSSADRSRNTATTT